MNSKIYILIKAVAMALSFVLILSIMGCALINNTGSAVQDSSARGSVSVTQQPASSNPTTSATPSISAAATNQVIQANDKNADKASIEKMKPLLKYLALSSYNSSVTEVKDQPSPDMAWYMAYYVVTCDMRGMDTDNIYVVDNQTMFASDVFMNDTVYPLCFAVGELPSFDNVKSGIEDLISSIDGDYEFKITNLSDDLTDFDLEQYYINKDGDWVVTGNIVSNKLEANANQSKTEKWKTATVTLRPNTDLKFGFSIVGFVSVK